MNATQDLIFRRSSRILSIDVFRGLTILVMVFVNDVASVKGLPWWTYHIPPGEEGLTYVDVVFPAFLFIVGMAIPLALEKRMSRGDRLPGVIYHILIRSLSLVAIGLLIMNGRDLDPEATGLGYAAWNVLMFLAVILIWNVYPESRGRTRWLFRGLKWAGIALIVVLLIIYRREDNGSHVWLDLTNWSILGGIGWAYLSVALLFLILRGKFWPLVITLFLLVGLNVLSKAGYAGFIRDIPRILWPIGTGALASIVMAGLILSRIFVRQDFVQRLRGKWLAGLTFALILFLLGWLLMPFGLAKIGSTPSYTLYSASICILIFMAAYYLVDIRGVSGWASFIKPAGSNPLLTYILPDIYYAIFGLYHFSRIAGEGWPGVVRAFLFSLFILGVSAILTRLRVRLQL